MRCTGPKKDATPTVSMPCAILPAIRVLVRAFGSNTNAAQQHYVLFGRNENRNLTSFDPSRYLSSYGDLRAAFGTDTNAALLHYLTFGANEGRTLGFTTGAAPAGNADPLRRQDGILGAAS